MTRVAWSLVRTPIHVTYGCPVCLSHHPPLPSPQQAWPTGTQQILIPSSWQQVPGVAIHGTAPPSAVVESPLGVLHSGVASQQAHSWRWVDRPGQHLLGWDKGQLGDHVSCLLSPRSTAQTRSQPERKKVKARRGESRNR